MRSNQLLILLFLLTVVVAAGIFYLLKQESPPDLDLSPETESADRSQEEIAAGEPAKGIGLREIVVPADPSASDEDEGAMPASYRRALGRLKGRVVEPDRTPVPGLKVELYGICFQDLVLDAAQFMEADQSHLKFALTSTKTGEDGTFTISELYSRSLFLLGIDLDGPRSTTRFLDAVPGPGETVDLGDIVLAPYAVLLGKVVDGEGEPVSGARVRATQLPPVVFLTGLQDFREGASFLFRVDSRSFVIDPPSLVLQLYHMLPFPETRTDVKGAFRLEGVPLGLHTVVVDRPYYVTAQKCPVSTMRGGEQDLGEIVLQVGIPLEGRVVDVEERPIAGAEVRLGALHGFPEFALLQPPLTTGEDGKFFAPGVERRSTFAAVRRYPKDPWTVVGPFNPETAPPVVVLPAGYDLKLIIRNSEGKPVEGARLKMRSGSEVEDLQFLDPPAAPTRRMKSREGGIVEISDLVPGTYELFVSAPGYGITREEVVVVEGGVEKEIVLVPSLSAVVQVLEDKNKTPVEWARVQASIEGTDWFFSPAKVSCSRTDAQGNARLKYLSPGSYRIHVSHPDFAITEASLELPVESETTVFLKPGGKLEGIVHTGGELEGNPYMVTLVLNEGVGGPEAETPRMTITDLEGRFLATHLNPGVWEVVVMKRLLDQDPLGLMEVVRKGPLLEAEVEVWSGETSYIELDLAQEDLGPSGTVAGRVRIDGTPAHGAVLTLRAKGRRFEAEVAPSGTYKMEQVPVGEHSLRFSTLPGPTGRYDFSLRRGIEVLEDTTCFEDFEILTGRLSGVVVQEGDGLPIPGLQVTTGIESDDAPYSVSMRTVTDLSGRFLFEGLPMGVYSVMIDSRTLNCRPVKDIKVFPGGSAGPVTLVLIETVHVEGRLELDETLQDVRWLGMSVKLEDDQSGARAWIQVDTGTGFFKSDRLVPGRYEAQIYCGADVKYEKLIFDVPTGGIANLLLVPERKE